MANKKKTFIYFLTTLMIFGFFLAGSIGLLYHFESKDSLARLELEEQATLKLQLALISKNFETIISDLLFLSKQNELLHHINFNKNTYFQWISREYSELAKRKKTYDQIRYIDKSGMEIVRVNFNHGTPEIIQKPDLQFKGDRYYFKDTFKLDPNKIFVSPLDLNIEKNEIEKPLKPMIRFGTPVFNDAHEKSGIIMINYLAGEMLSFIEHTDKLSTGNSMLINQEGFWLLSPDKNEEWGFMIKERANKKFSEKFPGVWRQILSSEICQIKDPNGLFTSATIYPLGESSEGVTSSSGCVRARGESQQDIESGGYYWKLISHIPIQDLNSRMESLHLKLSLMGLLLFLVAVFPSWVIAGSIVRRKSHLIELYRTANYDKLTNLPNRAMFMDKFNEILKQSKRYERKFALLFIDLDGFKSVNDTLGHDAGDELLIKVANRLRECVRDSDIVARLGGDEFTVIFSTITSLKDPKLGAQKIIDNLAVPFTIKGHKTKIGASIGVSVYPDNGDDIELLLKKADNAMYLAKEKGKNTYKLSSD